MKLTQVLTSATVALSMVIGTAAFAKAPIKTLKIEQGAITVDGYIYKDNVKSDMQVALRAIGQDSGVNVGYGIMGSAIVGPNKGDDANMKIDVDFTDMECNKVGELPRPDLMDENTTVSNYDPKLALQLITHVGKLVVQGKPNAKTGAIEGDRTTISADGDWSTFVGIKLKGSYSQKSTGEKHDLYFTSVGAESNAIQLGNLEVNGVKSIGQLNYVYGKKETDPSSYFASKDAKFGTYAIVAGNSTVADAPIITYRPATDSFQFDLGFGEYIVTGTVMFVSNAQPPKLDKNSFFNMTKPLDVVAPPPGAGKVDKATTTTGNFSLTIKRRGGGSIQISKNLAKDSNSNNNPDEVQLRALLAFILTTAYDTFGN